MTMRTGNGRTGPVKILVAGGFGVGKTSLVCTASEISPVCTEEVMTTASEGVDDLSGVRAKTTTTVAMDFGRVTIDRNVVVSMFGLPGQDRFWFMWDELCRGAVGALVLVDPMRLAECFAILDSLTFRRLPFVVAANQFDGAKPFDLSEVSDALAVGADVPVVRCDPRNRDSVLATLIALVQHALARRGALSRAGAPT